MRNLLLVLLILASGYLRADVRVSAKGRAPGDKRTARRQALVDALRQAVRKGAGVDMLSMSEVENFVLKNDAISSSSFGYVRDYTVLGEGEDTNGFYSVTVEATVGKGQPGMRDMLALRQIILLKGSPRIIIECHESISKVEMSTSAALSVLKKIAQDIGLDVINARQLARINDLRARRDRFVGDRETRNYRRSDLASKADFLVLATISGSYNGTETIGGADCKSYTFGADLEGVWRDTAASIVTENIPSTQVTDFMSGSTTEGARNSLLRLLEGDRRLVSRTQGRSAISFFRKLIAKWITELDSGVSMILEFKGITRDDFNRLIGELNDTNGIESVTETEFDKQLMSRITVKSRLSSSQLAESVLKYTGNAFEVDKSTKNYVSFSLRTTHDKTITNQLSADPQADTAQTGSGIPGGLLALALGALAVILFVAVAVARKKKRD